MNDINITYIPHSLIDRVYSKQDGVIAIDIKGSNDTYITLREYIHNANGIIGDFIKVIK